MAPTGSSILKCTIDDEGVALLELNRPQKRNALSQALIGDLVTTIAALQKEDRVRAVVLTGTPGGAFCAGADLTELVTLSTAEAHRKEFLKDLCDAFGTMKKPMIAAVMGFALGGGFEIAMMCDIIYAAENSKFGLPELKIGTIPGAGGTQRLTRALGKFKAMELILTGNTITGSELNRLGLVSRSFPEQDVLPAAIALGRKIAAMSAPVIQIARQSILNAEQTDLDAGLKHEKALYYSTFSLQDRSEGMQAFLGKRPAVFKHN